MAPVVVLVTFYSRSGTTETLALSHAVGAVQSRALIRLRRIADTDPERTIASYPEHAESLRRMHKEYVPPAEADVLGADVIVLAPPADADPSAAEWKSYMALLARLAAEERLGATLGAVVDAGNRDTAHAFARLLLSAGLIVVPAAGPGQGADAAAATAHGRRVASVAGAVKAALAHLH